MLEVGERVEVEVYTTVLGHRTKRNRRGVTMQCLRGRVVWAGPRFCTVEMDAGYRECFGYDELRRVGKRESA